MATFKKKQWRSSELRRWRMPLRWLPSWAIRGWRRQWQLSPSFVGAGLARAKSLLDMKSGKRMKFRLAKLNRILSIQGPSIQPLLYLRWLSRSRPEGRGSLRVRIRMKRATSYSLTERGAFAGLERQVFLRCGLRFAPNQQVSGNCMRKPALRT